MKRLIAGMAFLLALVTSTVHSANYGGHIVNILSGYLSDAGQPRDCMLVMLDTYPAWLALAHNHPAYEELRAMILSAQITNRSINIYTTGINAPGNCIYEEINFVGYF